MTGRGSAARTGAAGARQAAARQASLLRRLGVTRLSKISGFDRSGIAVAAAVRPLGYVLQVATGKGTTDAVARASALGEAAELWAAERVAPEELRYGTAAGLRQRGAEVWDGDLGSAGERQRSDLWASARFAAFRAGRELFTGREVWLPAAALHCPPPGAAPLGPRCWRWTSNAMGAHRDPARATAHALCEAIERDQLARALPRGWTSAALARALTAATLPKRLAAWRARLGRRGLQLELFDLTPGRGSGGLGLPLAAALLCDRESGPVPLTAGYACHFDRETALRGALLEACQSRLTDLQGLREDIAPMDPRAAGRVAAVLASRWSDRQAEQEAGPASARGPAGSADGDSLDGDGWEGAPLNLRALLEPLRRAGLREVAVVPLGPPDFELSVVKIVAPRLRVSALL